VNKEEKRKRDYLNKEKPSRHLAKFILNLISFSLSLFFSL